MFPAAGAEFARLWPGVQIQVRRMQPGFLFFGIFGKVMATRENRVTVDPHRVDAHGIPIPVMHFRFGENDVALWRDSNRSLAEICANVKSQMFSDMGERPSGFASHEVGTIRMGKNPKTSVLNSLLPGARGKETCL